MEPGFKIKSATPRAPASPRNRAARSHDRFTTLRNLARAGGPVHASERMIHRADLSLFWRLQIAGWLLFAVGTLPFKFYAFESVTASLLVTVVREPLGLLMSSGLRLIYRRYFPENARSVRLGVVIVIASATLGAIDVFLGHAIVRGLGFHEPPHILFGVYCFRSVIYASWSLLYFGIKAQSAARIRELSVARAETAARDAELQLLRTQVDPHFLFNSLNTVLATLDPSQTASRRVVEGLSDYLRYSLQHRHDTFVPLRAEFDATLAYLAVEQERFRGELLADCHLDDRARDFPVPGVLLQPLVENAVKYARETSEPPYRLRLQVDAPAPYTIAIEVANSGEWVEPLPDPGPHGTGLANLRRRLAQLYPARHELTVTHADGWVHVRVRLMIVPPSIAAHA